MCMTMRMKRAYVNPAWERAVKFNQYFMRSTVKCNQYFYAQYGYLSTGGPQHYNRYLSRGISRGIDVTFFSLL